MRKNTGKDTDSIAWGNQLKKNWSQTEPLLDKELEKYGIEKTIEFGLNFD
ncbi:hypothetical protein [Cytobacillus gottheilii]